MRIRGFYSWSFGMVVSIGNIYERCGLLSGLLDLRICSQGSVEYASNRAGEELMGYFSNGTEGELYENKYCSRCIHNNNSEKGCAVWDAHSIYNYDECNKKESILHILIPRSEDGTNKECAMFIETEEIK